MPDNQNELSENRPEALEEKREERTLDQEIADFSDTFPNLGALLKKAAKYFR